MTTTKTKKEKGIWSKLEEIKLIHTHDSTNVVYLFEDWVFSQSYGKQSSRAQIIEQLKYLIELMEKKK